MSIPGTDITHTPKLRFREFKEEWSHKPLNQLLVEKKQRNLKLFFGKSDVLSVSGELGIINQIKHKGRSFAGASVHNYHIVDNGDIVYTKSPLKSNPYGIIKVNKGNPGIVSTLYAVYTPREDTSGLFIDYYFRLHDRVNKYLRPLVHKGAKNDMKINNLHALSGHIYIPGKSEQSKIAEFLSVVDDKIFALQSKSILLRQYKKGVMQAIFNLDLRYKNEDGRSYPAWEEKTLGDLTDRVTAKNMENNKNVLTISAQKGLVSQRDYFNKSVAAKDLTGYYLLHRGDFAYNRSYSKGYPMGAIKKLNNYEKGVVSTLYICFRVKEKENEDFLEQVFDAGMHNIEIAKVAQEGARNHGLLNIAVGDFFSIKLGIPSKDEQTKISNLLKSIDNKIQLEEDKLEKTKMLKKVLLKEMFV